MEAQESTENPGGHHQGLWKGAEPVAFLHVAEKGPWTRLSSR